MRRRTRPAGAPLGTAAAPAPGTARAAAPGPSVTRTGRTRGGRAFHVRKTAAGTRRKTEIPSR